MALLARLRDHFDLTNGRSHSPVAAPGPSDPDPPASHPVALQIASTHANPGGHASRPRPRNPTSDDRDPNPEPTGKLAVFLHYLAIVLGVLAKYFIASTHGDEQLNWLTVVSSLILSAVVYPYVYKRVCDPSLSTGMQYFVSFQNGFFFQTLLEEIQNKLT